jgi:hypothetical protein
METQGRMAATLVKIAAVYMLIGMGVGMFVGITGRYAFISVHSHASLVGWTTMALAGLIYLAFPPCERSRLAPVHFWLHNAGLPLMVCGLAVQAAGSDRAEPFVALGSTLVLAGMLVFTVNVVANARAGLPLRESAETALPSGRTSAGALAPPTA